MDMSSMTMAASTSTGTASLMTSTGTAMPTSSANAMSSTMGGMDMSSMGDTACKISMTWNWYTVGACFISDTWRVTSTSVFAGSCIGVICLVISLEFLRRLQREYDNYIRRSFPKHSPARTIASGSLSSGEQGHASIGLSNDSKTHGYAEQLLPQDSPRSHTGPPGYMLIGLQLLRALIHAIQFGVAYFVMLLAMYYNGYIIICIIIGAFLGSFIFSWDQLYGRSDSAPPDITGCCG